MTTTTTTDDSRKDDTMTTTDNVSTMYETGRFSYDDAAKLRDVLRSEVDDLLSRSVKLHEQLDDIIYDAIEQSIGRNEAYTKIDCVSDDMHELDRELTTRQQQLKLAEQIVALDDALTL